MKKIFTLALLGLYLGAYAQLPVSQMAEKKKVVLEEYTGKTCTYCPDGHKIAAGIKAADPENVFLINIHTGGYASGTPNYRTAFGSALAGQFGITSFPSGTVNRVEESNRGEWAAKGATIKTQDAFVNVACDASIDLNTRLLTVNVEAFYTDTPTTASNFLNVVFTQDGVKGPQVGASSFYPEMIDANGDYTHNHMLRHMLTGQWGDEITNIGKDSLITRTYTYTLPATIGDVDVDMAKLHVVAFMAESHKDIINGSGADPVLTGLTNNLDAEMMSTVVPEVNCAGSFSPEVSIRNWGNTEITSMKIESSTNGSTPQVYNWTGNLLSGHTTEIVLPTLSYTVIASNDIKIEIKKVNGAADNVLSNNVETKVVAEADKHETTSMQLTFDSDKYSGTNPENGNAHNETSWKLFGADGTTLLQESGVVTSNTTFDVTLDLATESCYIFEFYDKYGDGMGTVAGNEGANEVKLAFDGTTAYSHTGKFKMLHYEFSTFKTISAIKDVENVIDFIVFPNPATDIVNVNVETANNNEVTVEIVDLSGKTLEINKVVENKTSFNTSKYSNGIYVINVLSNGVSIASTSVVVK